jgi:hypothetical protein
MIVLREFELQIVAISGSMCLEMATKLGRDVILRPRQKWLPNADRVSRAATTRAVALAIPPKHTITRKAIANEPHKTRRAIPSESIARIHILHS